MQQNVVRVEISVDDRLRQQVEVVQALRHVQRDPQLGQDVHGAALLVKKTEKLERQSHLSLSKKFHPEHLSAVVFLWVLRFSTI